MTPAIIREFTKKDIPTLENIMKPYFKGMYSINLEKYLTNTNRIQNKILVAESDILLGLIDANYIGNLGIIERLAVLSNCQRQGIGKQLLEAMLQHYQTNNVGRVILSSISNNSTKFYLNQGFNIIEKYPNNIKMQKLL